MAEPINEIRIFTCKAAIQAYIKKITGEECTDYMFRVYIECGMPARVVNKRWYAHADNIDQFFVLFTRVASKKYEEESK